MHHPPALSATPAEEGGICPGSALNGRNGRLTEEEDICQHHPEGWLHHHRMTPSGPSYTEPPKLTSAVINNNAQTQGNY